MLFEHCPICGKRTYWWTKKKVAGTSSALLEVYMGHRDCVIKQGQNDTDRFIEENL